MIHSNNFLPSGSPFRWFLFLIVFSPLTIDAQSLGCGFAVEGQNQIANEIGVPRAGTIGNAALSRDEVQSVRGQYNDILEVTIPSRSNSPLIRFSDFGFQLPEHGHVRGLKLSIMRYAEGSTDVKDIRIMLNNNGQLIGKDKSTQNYSGDWSTMAPWVFGNSTDIWGVNDISPSMVNSAGFGIEMQLKNESDEEVTIMLDQIMVQVYYQDVIDICGHPCITATIDNLDESNTYNWSASPELRIEEAGDHLDLLNVFADDMAFGMYELCLETRFPDGAVDNCCRSVRYSECAVGQIGDFVWNDMNGNGIQDQGEAGIDNVRVNLYDDNYALIDVQYTIDGRYLFQDVSPGNYFLQTYVDGHELTTVVDNEDLGSDGEGIFVAGSTRLINVASGQIIQNIDFGFRKSGQVCGTVWEDVDGNNIQDTSEQGLINISVELLDASGEVLLSTMTDMDGVYCFYNIMRDNYFVRFNGLDDYTISSFRGNPLQTSAREYEVVYGTDESSMGNDLGVAAIINFGSIGNKVWIDANDNGIEDPSELPVVNAIVRLRDCSGNLIRSIVTNDSGEYIFTDVSPGEYTVDLDYTDPAFTVRSSFGPAVCFELEAGENKEDVDFRLVPRGVTITVSQWVDENQDGAVQLSEPLIGGAIVELYDCNNNLVDFNDTDLNGQVSFIVDPGEYYIKFEEQAGLEFLTSNHVTNANGIGSTDCLTIDSDIQVNGRMLAEQTYAIQASLWIDEDEDVVFDFNEVAIVGTEVTLVDCVSGAEINVLTTFLDGNVSFNDIPAGSYYLRADEVLGLQYGLASDFTNANGPGTTDCMDLVNDNLAFGLTYLPVDNAQRFDLAGMVWLDEDDNGLIGNTEPGMPNVEVRLYDDNAQMVDEVVTASDGTYIFEAKEEGAYQVQFMKPLNYMFSDYRAGIMSDLDSEILFTSTGMTDTIILNSDKLHINAGLVLEEIEEVFAISGTVWEDVDRDGILMDGEPVLQNATVNLIDRSGRLIDITTTDIYGWYRFTDVPVGEYMVRFRIPVDAVATLYQVDGSDFDSELMANGDTEVIQLVDRSINGVNAGYYFPEAETYSIAGTLWEDTDRDGILMDGEPVMEGQEIRLFNEFGIKIATTYTDIYGWYIFPGLAPADYKVIFRIPVDAQATVFQADGSGFDSEMREDGKTDFITITNSNINGVNGGYYFEAGTYDIMGTVWEDDNGDGIAENSELDAGGLEVELLSESGDILEIVMTDDDGYYEFEDVSPGKYDVRFNLPLDVEATVYQAGGNSEDDSELETINAPINVEITNADITGLNAGYYYPVGLGDYIWLDVNANGIQDSDENGVNDQIINLYRVGEGYLERTWSGSGPDGASGYYYFSGLRPGTFYIEIRSQQGVSYSSPFEGDEDEDSDIDNSFGFGTSTAITLNSGEQTEDLDIGLILEPGTIGNRVWSDVNQNGVQDPGEAGVNDIVVELYDENGELYLSTITGTENGEDGMYLFEDVFPALYYVKIYPPDNFIATIPDQGGIDALDSDINQSNGLNTTSYSELSPAESDLDIDAGIFFNPSPINDFGTYAKTTTYPNPVSDVLSVRTSVPFESATIKLEVLDSSGRQLIEKQTDNISRTSATNLDVNVNDLTEGVYILRVSVGTRTELLRFIKVKQ